jgi:hypothetical protein
MYAEARPTEWLPVAGSERLTHVDAARPRTAESGPAVAGVPSFEGWYVDLETHEPVGP